MVGLYDPPRAETLTVASEMPILSTPCSSESYSYEHVDPEFD